MPQNPAAREFLQGRIEVLLTRQLQQDPNEWECLVRPGRKIGVGEQLFFGEHDELQAEVIGRGEFGRASDSALRQPRLEDDFLRAVVEKIGHIPLPPYIARRDSFGDRERYQTVYARERGSVAAPTAGLHFTPEILRGCGSVGLRPRDHAACRVGNLSAGAGGASGRTPACIPRPIRFRPEAAEKIARARGESRRVVAVGTTTVRTLEFAAQQMRAKCAPGRARRIYLFIRDTSFRWCEALLTNFHLPRVHVADAGVRSRRTRKSVECVRARGCGTIPVLFVWGLHVFRMKRL